MTYLSIIEKLNILFNTMMDFHFILVFSVLLMIFTFMFIAKKITIKKYTLLMILSFVIVFGISIISNYEVLSNTFDNFTTIFFGNIYFPSIYVYIGVLVISFIAFIVSILNVMLKKIYKVINSVMFVVNNVLFVIILNIIAKNKIDIFSIDSLYTNTSLVAILELSMGLFILWILSLFTIYITNSICIRIGNKRFVKDKVQEEIFNPVLEVSNDIVNDVNTLTDDNIKSVLVEDISNNEVETVVEQIDNVIEDNVVIDEVSTVENIVEETSGVTFNDILNGTIPVTYYNNSSINNEYNLVDPQSVYEDNYNKVKSEVVFNDMLIEKPVVNEIQEPQLSVEELTKIEKARVSEERLSINTISLNDLIDEEVINKVKDTKDVIEVNDNTYSLDDYKKFIKMLTEIKNYSNGNNINIDDAVAIGLINNYSIDDCMKFKNILENNLN